METIQILFELFPYALFGSILAGIICSFLGVFVVSQRAVFLGAALTQVSIAGVAFAFLHLVNLEDLIASAFGIQVIEESFLHHFEHTFFSLLFAVIAVLIIALKRLSNKPVNLSYEELKEGEQHIVNLFREVHEVVRLHQHVIELDEGQAFFQAAGETLRLDHAVHGTVPAHFAQEIDVGKIHQPVGVIQHGRVVVAEF